MSEKQSKGGCNIHGAYEVCGHTTLTCPELKAALRDKQSGWKDALDQRTVIIENKAAQEEGDYLSRLDKVAERESRASQEESIREWQESVVAIYRELKANKERLRFIARKPEGVAREEGRGLVDTTQQQAEEIKRLTDDFLAKNPDIPGATRQLTETILLEIDGFLELAARAKTQLEGE